MCNKMQTKMYSLMNFYKRLCCVTTTQVKIRDTSGRGGRPLPPLPGDVHSPPTTITHISKGAAVLCPHKLVLPGFACL